eukprot:scaffold46884_cov63-Phaeocystis_antarctica.AAC.6
MHTAICGSHTRASPRLVACTAPRARRDLFIATGTATAARTTRTSPSCSSRCRACHSRRSPAEGVTAQPLRASSGLWRTSWSDRDGRSGPTRSARLQ